MSVNEYIERTIDSIEKYEKASFICNLEIDYADLKEVFPNKGNFHLDGRDIWKLENMIKIYPLFGGGLDGNGRINILIALKDSNIKIERIHENFEIKLKLKKRNKE